MSSPLPYAPYQSHRRGQSSLSSIASGMRTHGQASGDTPGLAAPLSSSSASSSSSLRLQPPTQSTSPPSSPRRGFVRSVSSEQSSAQVKTPMQQSAPATKPSEAPHINVQATSALPSSSGRAAGANAPPPLRKASTLRSTSQTSTFGPPLDTHSNNGKGKQREGINGHLQSEGNGITSLSTSSSAVSLDSMQADKSASKSSLDVSWKSNGHQKRHSFSPLPSGSNQSSLRSHNRTASGDALHPVLPHHMSTAQRLRSTQTPTSSQSANSSPNGTPRTRSPAPMFPQGNVSLFPGAQYVQEDALFQESLGRRTAYRPGFQPKGVYRIRTDEFASARLRKRQSGRSHLANTATNNASEKASHELESQRLERRLEKLIALHYEQPPTLSYEAAAAKVPLWLPGTIRKARLHAEEDRMMREEEMQIVKWEQDTARKACAICNNAFSFTVRKHHCRLCGRLVCASPHLGLPPTFYVPDGPDKTAISEEEKDANQKKCSGLIVAVPSPNGGARKIRDVPRWEEVRVQGQEGSLRYCAIRVCKDCRETIMHRQYMLDDGRIPQYIRLYDSLVALQREIEQSLPEFQEMILGLQKQDAIAALGAGEIGINDPLDPQSTAMNTSSLAAAKAKNRTSLALQRDAAQARKQLLANFANYDLAAKRIRDLDDEGNASLGRLKMAVVARANMFLQANMFPLQNLPKLPPSRSKKTASKNAEQKRIFQSNEIAGSDFSADARARDIVADDPAAARESLGVLEQQLSLVRQYAASASKARKFQDASSLQASAHELETEIARLRRLGVS